MSGRGGSDRGRGGGGPPKKPLTREEIDKEIDRQENLARRNDPGYHQPAFHPPNPSQANTGRTTNVSSSSVGGKRKGYKDNDSRKKWPTFMSSTSGMSSQSHDNQESNQMVGRFDSSTTSRYFDNVLNESDRFVQKRKRVNSSGPPPGPSGAGTSGQQSSGDRLKDYRIPKRNNPGESDRFVQKRKRVNSSGPSHPNTANANQPGPSRGYTAPTRKRSQDYYHMNQLCIHQKPRLISSDIHEDEFLARHFSQLDEQGKENFISPTRFAQYLYESNMPDLDLPPPSDEDDQDEIKRVLKSIIDLQTELHRAFNQQNLGANDPIYAYMAHIPRPVLDYHITRLGRLFESWRDRLHELIHPDEEIEPGSESWDLPWYRPSDVYDRPQYWSGVNYDLVGLGGGRRVYLEGRPKLEGHNTLLNTPHVVRVPRGTVNVVRRGRWDYDHMLHSISIRSWFKGPVGKPRSLPVHLSSNLNVANRDIFVLEQLKRQTYGLHGFIDSYLFSILLYLGHHPPILTPPRNETNVWQIRRTLVSILELHEFLYHGLTNVHETNEFKRVHYLEVIPFEVVWYQLHRLDRKFHWWRNYLLSLFQRSGHYLNVPDTFSEEYRTNYIPLYEANGHGQGMSWPLQEYGNSVTLRHLNLAFKYLDEYNSGRKLYYQAQVCPDYNDQDDDGLEQGDIPAIPSDDAYSSDDSSYFDPSSEESDHEDDGDV